MKGKITISKRRDNHDNSAISIHIQDDASSTTFFEGVMSLEGFAEAVTGLGFVEIYYKVRGVENIGKNIERKCVDIALGTVDFNDNRRSIAETEAAKLEGDGWICDKYFGSRDSFYWKNGELHCRARFVRYVDVVAEAANV